MLHLARLRTLHEFARLGTVHEAARSLAYSPSAVSQQLTQLERDVGIALTEKAGRRLVLTAAGRVLAQHARTLLEDVERAEADLAATKPVLSGVLRVASFQSVMLSLIPPALTILFERHPELQVEVHQREAEAAYAGLLTHEFDLVLGEEYPGLDERHRAGVQREALLEDPLLLAIPREGSWAGARGLEDLSEANWTADPDTVLPGIWVRSRLRAQGIEPRVRFETIDLLLQAHLVRSGHAVAIIPGLVAREHLTGADLLELTDSPHRRLHTAVRTGRSADPATRALRSALAEAAGALEAVPPGS
ncbi:LysR family transcriptional regulator [Brachybacterium endophyticum]|uniref:LysR family transcriptional regulator n=1 Tax=Brachybacterium endophyticum TaxID=2182385 RepID=A0A2U2RI48_9MICO|nr:LysR family transcriptional regulator [Brachybacterium endophyticum]PWH05557.1 LysR family transcriptional regulator [Brachybacterium endophyticum]